MSKIDELLTRATDFEKEAAKPMKPKTDEMLQAEIDRLREGAKVDFEEVMNETKNRHEELARFRRELMERKIKKYEGKADDGNHTPSLNPKEAPATDFEKAAAKDSKADPKAKVRNRGKVALPAEHPKVKDKQDHYPCNDAGQARNALSRVSQHPSAPSWFKGSLSELQNIVRRFVKKHYPSIEVGSTKKAFELNEAVLNKYAGK